MEPAGLDKRSASANSPRRTSARSGNAEAAPSPVTHITTTLPLLECGARQTSRTEGFVVWVRTDDDNSETFGLHECGKRVADGLFPSLGSPRRRIGQG